MTVSVQEMVEKFRETEGCFVRPPSGLPSVSSEEVLPDSVVDLYKSCGGISVFPSATYAFEVVGPSEFVRANPLIAGGDYEFDISYHWYIICTESNENHLTMDCHPLRLERCYDSFHENHGLAGESPIVAMSLLDLMASLLKAKGQYLHWLHRPFLSLGDAYDGVESS